MPPPPTSATLQWLSLVAIIWLQSVNGTNTTFPAYSSQLKNLLSLSQLQLNNLAFASDAGKLFGFISGFAALHLPLPLVLLAGSLLGLAGYGAQYLFLTGTFITSLSYPQIFLLTVLAGNSICWINTVCYVVAVRNFPAGHQPLAVGLSTAYQGLSAKIYTVLAAAIFPSSKNPAEAYLLLSSLLPLLVTTFTAPLLRNGEVEWGPIEMGRGGVVAMFLVTIATGVYSVISSLTFISRTMSPSRGTIGISIFLSAPLAVPVAIKLWERHVAGKKKGSTRIHTMNYVEEIENGVVEGGGETKLPMETAVATISGEGKSGGDVSGDEKEGFVGVGVMVKRVEFWVYFGAYLCGPTIGLVFLNNLGQIAESRGELRTSSLVALSSSFGFFGRLVPSFLDYFLARSRCKMMISRPASIAALMAPMAAAFFLLVINTTASFNHVALYVSTAVIGVCTGAITSISVSTTSDLFGTANFSLNHNIVVANIPLGSFAFGYLAAFFYHREGGGGGGGKCMGMLCYRDTFVIWGSLCGFGTLLALVLHARTRKMYSQTVLAT
ncbi:unnamed protein product [Linum trigynum]|uniref:Nodulin-like domain-containing protein n=1 Tax=Linum trigynum TaxID=586398 RepID=A0AAV2D6F7_9ROSI